MIPAILLIIIHNNNQLISFTNRFAITNDDLNHSVYIDFLLLFFCPLFSQQLHIQEDLNVLPVKMHRTTMNATAGLQISTVHEVPTSP